MYRYLGLISVVLLAISVGQALDQCTPSSTNCNFYENCLEALRTCGSNGYAIGYGKKYCISFLSHEILFSRKGKAFLSASRFCLQQALQKGIADGTINASTSCDDIKSFAWASHLGCYTEINPSICQIPFSDWILLLGILKDSLIDPMTIDMMLEVGAECGSDYLSRVVAILL